jgi:phosphoserine phosphatase
VNETTTLLPSWRPGPARDDLVSFLDRSSEIAPDRRLACFDNDGTLWCERPHYVQLEFMLDALGARVAADPALGATPEFAALISRDAAAVRELGLPRIAMALTDLFSGMTADAFAATVRDYMAAAIHPTLGRPLRSAVYAPMVELVTELGRRGFTVAVVTGGGTEFVRAVSRDLYGVPPEGVVGTLVEYDYTDDGHGPVLTRTNRVSGALNDGPAKVSNIQAQLGRRPVLAAGNTTGDREMLSWAETNDGPTLAILVDHDDDDREFSYPGTGEGSTEAESIVEVGRRRGWTVVSMARDWDVVFSPAADESPARER